MTQVTALLAADEVRVWYRATQSIDDDAIHLLERTLSEDELARGRRLMFASDRREFVAAHALVRDTLSKYGNVNPDAWRFDTSSLGKPAIASDHATMLAFNLSHTRGLVACAVARTAVLGVDVERIDEGADRRSVAARYFSEAENGDLNRSAPSGYASRFVELWTLKESYVKAVGTGIGRPLDDLTFRFSRDGIVEFNAPSDAAPQLWQFALAAPSPGYRLAVAVRRPSPAHRFRIVIHDAADGTALAPVRQSPNETATTAT